MLTKISELFQLFESNKIDYCHWKSINHLDATLKGITDLDILVDNSKSNLLETHLLAIGFERFETANLRSYPGIHDYVCLDISGVWVHLHLHYNLNLGDRWVKAFHFPIEKKVLSRSLYLEDIKTKIVNPYDELMMLCLRMCLKFKNPFNDKLIKEEMLFIKANITASTDDYNDYYEVLPNLKLLIDTILNNSSIDFNKLNKISKSVTKELIAFRRFNLFTFKYLSLKRKVYRYYVEFRRRFIKEFSVGRREISNGGKIIAIVGIDGSGKTSVVSEMQYFYSRQMNVTRVFLGNGQSGASWYRKLIFNFYGTKFKNSKEGKFTKKRTSTFYALWILLCLFDKENNLKKAIKARANGNLVLSDRWPQNKISGTFDGARLDFEMSKNFIVRYVQNRELKFLKLSKLISPDLVIKLKIDPEVSVIRKPNELSLAEAKSNSSILDELVWNECRHDVIVANDDFITVSESVKQKIWKLITNNF